MNPTNLEPSTMVGVAPGLQLSYVAMYSRILFRKETWSKVGTVLSRSQEKFVSMTKKDDHVFKDHVVEDDIDDHEVLKDGDGFAGLKRANWNMVSNSKDSISAAGYIAPNPDEFSPIAVVMIYIDVSVTELPLKEWSEQFIDDCVRNGCIYGKIGEKTHVVVQLFFTGIKSSSFYTSSISNDTLLGQDDRVSDVNDAVGVVIIDSLGTGYSYNIPTNHCQHLAFRSVSRLMDIAVGKPPTMVMKVVNHTRRSKYDDYLYAMFITSSCAAETTILGIQRLSPPVVGNKGGRKGQSDLEMCRPSSRVARPTRVIANLRFLMFLSTSTKTGVTDDLLLDERNTLDSFRSMVMDIKV